MGFDPGKSTAEEFEAPLLDPLLKMAVGSRLKLEHGLKDQKIRFTGVLAGMTPGEYLIVRVFATHELLGRLSEGESLFVSFISEGNAYAFTATISSSIIKPALMIFLDYPDIIKSWKIRKAPRVPCGFSATVKAGRGEYRAIIVNISEGGCKVCLDNVGADPLALDIGQRISLCFYIAEAARAQEIDSMVKYFSRDSEFLEIGVEFDRENSVALSDIKRYVSGVIHTIGSSSF